MGVEEVVIVFIVGGIPLLTVGAIVIFSRWFQHRQLQRSSPEAVERLPGQLPDRRRRRRHSLPVMHAAEPRCQWKSILCCQHSAHDSAGLRERLQRFRQAPALGALCFSHTQPSCPCFGRLSPSTASSICARAAGAGEGLRHKTP